MMRPRKKIPPQKHPDNFSLPNTVSWFPGHMKVTTDLIKRLAEKVDAVAEILDARIPLSGHNPLIRESSSLLPRLIVLNKADLANPRLTSRWESHFKREGYAFIALSCTEGRRKKILAEVETAFRRLLGDKRETFIALVCGIPNVGKSTFINLLTGERKTRVGNRPGITTDKQILKVEGGSGKRWAVIDLPGLLPTKLTPKESFHLSLCGTLKEGLYEEIELASRFLKEHFLSSELEGIEKLTRNFDLTIPPTQRENREAWFWLEAIAKRRGYLLKNREIDYRAAATAVVRDFREGKLGRFTLESPPTLNDKTV